MRVSSWTVILIMSTLAVTHGQQTNAMDNCRSRETCTACIRSPNCTWCDIVIDDHAKEPPLRCVNRDDLPLAQWCDGGTQVNRMKKIKVIKNNRLYSGKKGEQIQIKPQEINVELRQGDEYRFILQYRQAEDYPVDLYLVADYSNSMGPFWEQLKKLGSRIVGAMTQLTANFRVGLGSFVDKNVRPMVRDTPRWDGYGHYSFKHHLSMTNKASSFVAEIESAKINGNYDYPEGGFDAVMQAMVCEKEIGWRSDARHIIVYVSDALPHLAGDGRLAGLPEPNDMQCHLNKSGYYSHAELQDYPSIGQIKWQANENNVNIIFAVPNKWRKLHQKVQSMIPGSTLGILAPTSDNIVELISSHYEKLVKTITMTSNSTSDFVDIKYFSRCLSPEKELQQTNQCSGVRVNNNVEFEVALKVVGCPEREEDWHQTIKIKPEGINEGVIINVELICGCECSKKIHKGETAIRAKECHDKGVLDCGVCSCDQGFYGNSCQCKGAEAIDVTANRNDGNSCRKDNSAMDCNGHGSCICGSCTCDKLGNSEQQFYGKFCQCDDFSCRYVDGKLCGGNGRCECGECKCNSGWGGPSCDCRDDIRLCLPPGDNAKVCSGAGECKCGRCYCDKGMGRDGKFCEECQTCPSQRCDEFKDCVECQVHKSGKLYEEDKSCLKCSTKIVRVDEIEEDPDKKKLEEHICRIAGDDGSTFVFTYTYDDDKDNKVITIHAKREKDVPVIGSFLAATLGAVLLTLLLGFLTLLIWKIVTHVHDRREYNKFLKESSQADWGQNENPLYREAVTTVKNPTFNRASGQVNL